MKHLILLAAVSISATSSLVAQENPNPANTFPENKTDYRNQTMWGAKAGANYANVYDAKGASFQNDARFGFAGGLFLAVPIGRYIGVQPEVMYAQKGFHATGSILGGTYDFTRTTTFLDIPLFFAFKPSQFLTVLAGPQYSYLLKQKDVFKNAATSIAQEQEFENADVRKNILCFSGGLDLTLQHFTGSARVGWDVMHNNGDASATTPRYKNTWLQATVGYRL